MGKAIVKINGIPLGKKVQDHVSRNKAHYAWGTSLVVAVVATGGAAFMLGRSMTPAEIQATAKQINILSKDNVLMQIVIKPGNSGDVLWDPENKVAYLSKGEASRVLGVTRTAIQKMVQNGQLLEVIDGYQGTAPVAP